LIGLGFRGWPANGNGEGEIVVGVRRDSLQFFGLDSHRGCRVAALKGKFGLGFVGEGLSTTRTVSLEAPVQLPAPLFFARRTQSEIALRGGKGFRLEREFRMITKITGSLSRREHRATLRADCIHR
jgi:hypothetical protein